MTDDCEATKRDAHERSGRDSEDVRDAMSRR